MSGIPTGSVMPEVNFNGPEGRLEGRYLAGKTKNAPIALILHPHPQHGGTMNNKVVYTLYHAFADRGFSVLRFNFRGVGRSQGEFDHGAGELSDAAAALDWIQTFNANARTCWVAGFSFGAWIGMQLLMRRPEIDGFISVSPPSSLFDFSFLAPCPASGIILHGGGDQHVPVEDAQKLAEKLQSQKNITVNYQVVSGADHFFTDRIDQLRKGVDDYLDGALAEPEPAAEEEATP